MRKLLWFLVVVAVLAVVADRAAAYVAERAIADRLQSSQGLRSTPRVDIAGFPFLTQLYSQRFPQITATATGVPVGDGRRSVTLSQLSMTFLDVRASRRFTTFEAATGTARATLPYAEVGRVLGLRVVYAGQGKVRASTTVSVLGQTIRPAITVDPRLVGGALRLVGGAAVERGLPAPVASALRRAFDVDVPLTRLPFGLRVTALRADGAGIELTLVGRDLSYSR